MTARLPSDQIKYAARRRGRGLRDVLTCPLCQAKPLRVVKERTTGFRLACRTCGLRFTVDRSSLHGTLRSVVAHAPAQPAHHLSADHQPDPEP